MLFLFAILERFQRIIFIVTPLKKDWWNMTIKENQKIIVLAVLIAFSCFLTVYFHLVLEISHVFTHFFYIPVILAAFWWKRKGIVVAVFLAGFLITGHMLFGGDVGIDEDYLRGFSFIFVSSVVALLSERVAREERKVEDSHAELDQIFQTAADGMRVVDKDFSVLRMNETFLKMAGISRDKAAGRKCYEVFPGHRCHTPGCPLTRILCGEECVENEVEKVRADGKKIPCIVTATPFRGSGGDVIGIVEDYKDITERKQAEEQMRQFAEGLEQKVADRTAQLNVSLKERGTLLKEIHHRVKNNLQVILSLISLQSRNIKDRKLLDILGEFQNRIMAMAHVHERMCRAEDISRIDLSEIVTFLGTSLFKFYKVNPEVIRLNVELKDIQISINTAIPISLIINELLSNSIKYAFPKGTPGEITIAGRREADTIVLSIRDTGIGIPKDLDWMRNKQSLGHRLVVSLVEQLSGTIELDRTAGTAFTIVVQKKE